MFLAPRAVNLFLEVPQEATEGMARRKLHFASSVAPVHGLGAAAGGLGYRCRTHKLPAEFSSAFTCSGAPGSSCRRTHKLPAEFSSAFT